MNKATTHRYDWITRNNSTKGGTDAMFRFSLKALLSLMFIVASACHTLAHTSIIVAALVVLATSLTLLCVLIFGLIRRRPIEIALVGLCCCYLVVADGGVFPGMERLLPSEALLNMSVTHRTFFDDGRLCPNSLAMWGFRVLQRKQFRRVDDNVLSMEGRPKVDIEADVCTGLSSNSTVKLPAFAVTPTTGVRIVAKRDVPSNKAYFIIGHCWFANLVVIPTVVMLARN